MSKQTVQRSGVPTTSTAHAIDSLGVVDVLLSQLGPVKPVTPAQVLADEGDGHGSLIGIQLGHVQVIHKVD